MKKLLLTILLNVLLLLPVVGWVGSVTSGNVVFSNLVHYNELLHGPPSSVSDLVGELKDIPVDEGAGVTIKSFDIYESARGGMYVLESGVGKIIPTTVDDIKHLLITENGQAFFWSGKTNGIGGEIIAFEIANSKGGTTLEGLLKQRNIELPPWDPSDYNVMKLWEDVSTEYALHVTGEVRAVIGKDLRPGNIWQTKELPALMDNPNVTKIITIDPETLSETVIFTR